MVERSNCFFYQQSSCKIRVCPAFSHYGERREENRGKENLRWRKDRPLSIVEANRNIQVWDSPYYWWCTVRYKFQSVALLVNQREKKVKLEWDQLDFDEENAFNDLSYILFFLMIMMDFFAFPFSSNLRLNAAKTRSINIRFIIILVRVKTSSY